MSAVLVLGMTSTDLRHQSKGRNRSIEQVSRKPTPIILQVNRPTNTQPFEVEWIALRHIPCPLFGTTMIAGSQPYLVMYTE